MRYRVEYLHLPTSSRIIFTVLVPGVVDGEPYNSAEFAVARREGARWIEATGIGPECVFLSAVRSPLGTDILSVPAPSA